MTDRTACCPRSSGRNCSPSCATCTASPALFLMPLFHRADVAHAQGHLPSAAGRADLRRRRARHRDARQVAAADLAAQPRRAQPLRRGLAGAPAQRVAQVRDRAGAGSLRRTGIGRALDQGAHPAVGRTGHRRIFSMRCAPELIGASGELKARLALAVRAPPARRPMLPSRRWCRPSASPRPARGPLRCSRTCRLGWSSACSSWWPRSPACSCRSAVRARSAGCRVWACPHDAAGLQGLAVPRRERAAGAAHARGRHLVHAADRRRCALARGHPLGRVAAVARGHEPCRGEPVARAGMPRAEPMHKRLRSDQWSTC